MKKTFLPLFVLFGFISFVGCKAPKFAYKAPPACCVNAGPTIQVMPIADARTNREMDKVLAKGYMADVQRAIADELQSMNAFQSVTLITNATRVEVTDLKFSPKLYRLEWEIHNYGALVTKAFFIGLAGGIIGGSIYAATSVDVLGHSIMDVQVENTANHQLLLDTQYSVTITNRMKKASCDSSATKANMMVQAFQQTMVKVKTDLQERLIKNPQTNIVTAAKEP